jgi:probable HAF family extracellular repeat protein
MKRIFLVMAAFALQAAARADEPAAKYRLVTPKDDGIVAVALNGRGDLVGFEWVEEKERPGVVDQVPFCAKGKKLIKLPLLAGYTATHPAGISDTGLVVGRASKPAPRGQRVYLRNQAFIWDEATGIRGLGALKDDSASFACGVTRQGTCISGVSVGDNRVRACVWERVGDAWNGTALPQANQLGSQVVVISDNGRYVASIDGEVPCLWSRSDRGPWAREVIGGSGALAPRAVNNAGIVVGLSYTREGLTHAVIWTRGVGIKHLEKPKGYVRSEANAINNAGVVVGMADGPRGSAVGPNAFVYEKGRLRLIDECGPAFTSATAINDAGQVAGVLDKEDAAGADARGLNERPPSLGRDGR